MLLNVHDAKEREEIFPVLAVSLATIVFTLELPQHRDVTAEKMGKKCRRSCYSSAAVYYWRELGSCGSACVYLHSAPAVLGPVPSKARVL